MKNDRDQFEWHVLRHLDAAYDVAWWYLQNRQDAEDAVHESVLKAYEAFASFRGPDGRPWFFQIVRNRCLRFLEKRKAAPMSSLGDFEFEPVGAEDDPEAALLRSVQSEQVKAAISELPPPFREVLILKEFQEQSYAQIAEIVGAPVGTVMSRLSRARALLAKRLRAEAWGASS
ncbi:MAG TPA: sigma-70 family RNA polymerase sigma factor [Fimbriimonas sp.]|nr:sigma-70 family RNA polymerase sigma factor [Fimbriimonas sp.]